MEQIVINLQRNIVALQNKVKLSKDNDTPINVAPNDDSCFASEKELATETDWIQDQKIRSN